MGIKKLFVTYNIVIHFNDNKLPLGPIHNHFITI